MRLLDIRRLFWSGEVEWHFTDASPQIKVSANHLRPIVAAGRLGQPMQNGFIESFNGRLRDELLNEDLFAALDQARLALAIWRADYSNARPTRAVSCLKESTGIPESPSF
jgi:transposase InsO family protein